MKCLNEAYSAFSFCLFIQCVLVHVNDHKSKRVKAGTNRGSSLPQKTLLLKHLVSSPDFVTSHYDTMSHICIINAWRLVWQVEIDLAALPLLAVQGQVSVSCPIRVFQTEGEYRVAVLLTPNKVINLKISIICFLQEGISVAIFSIGATGCPTRISWKIIKKKKKTSAGNRLTWRVFS